MGTSWPIPRRRRRRPSAGYVNRCSSRRPLTLYSGFPRGSRPIPDATNPRSMPLLVASRLAAASATRTPTRRRILFRSPGRRRRLVSPLYPPSEGVRSWRATPGMTGLDFHILYYFVAVGLREVQVATQSTSLRPPTRRIPFVPLSTFVGWPKEPDGHDGRVGLRFTTDPAVDFDYAVLRASIPAVAMTDGMPARRSRGTSSSGYAVHPLGSILALDEYAYDDCSYDRRDG